ncbi:MAG: hypothetical protein WA705_08305 [Candidatus Ozemobacteraceae bacterium]
MSTLYYFAIVFGAIGSALSLLFVFHVTKKDSRDICPSDESVFFKGNRIFRAIILALFCPPILIFLSGLKNLANLVHIASLSFAIIVVTALIGLGTFRGMQMMVKFCGEKFSGDQNKSKIRPKDYLSLVHWAQIQIFRGWMVVKKQNSPTRYLVGLMSALLLVFLVNVPKPAVSPSAMNGHQKDRSGTSGVGNPSFPGATSPSELISAASLGIRVEPLLPPNIFTHQSPSVKLPLVAIGSAAPCEW